ncbi:hypothetical protein [Pseudomonas sp. Irchel s3h17]|uniref:hypothetical protein n=1 Tax=Pseudomonas sp. Irchel s3h17 TaxID=2009182 RepID=UPI0021158553|nr:hypothetical protein [Pseudomonas sp. Irchel s3h17]
MMRPDTKVEKVYLHPKPIDFRKSIDDLSALVELDINKNGEGFIFNARIYPTRTALTPTYSIMPSEDSKSQHWVTEGNPYASLRILLHFNPLHHLHHAAYSPPVAHMATGFGDPLWYAEAFAWLQAFLHL